MKAGFKASSFLILVSLTPPLCLAPRTGEGIASDNMKTVAGGKSFIKHSIFLPCSTPPLCAFT